jgi:lipopolysaccharide export LptBFGC system permease protein LptF
VPKNGTREEKAFLKDLKELILGVAIDKWGETKAIDALKKNKGTELETIKDGDNSEREENKGHYYFKAKSGTKKDENEQMNKPIVIDQQKQILLDASEIYGGCHVRASINAFAYEYQQRKGVSLWLNAVQKAKDDEPFGDGGNALDEFGFIETDNQEEEPAREKETEEIF